MKYMIVRNDNYREGILNSISLVESKVNSLIKQGWKPVGGVDMKGDTYGQFLLQAMIKEEVEPVIKMTRQNKSKEVTSLTDAKKAVERAKKRMQKNEDKL